MGELEWRNVVEGRPELEWRNMVEEKRVDKKYCTKCKSNSHSTQDCKGKPKSEGRGSVNNVKSGNPCPHCKIVHHYFDKNRGKDQLICSKVVKLGRMQE